MSDKDRLIIFDTTLRDGEQSPGASMNKEEKVRIAKALEKLRVDVIEAGFPIASPGDFQGVQAVARAIRDSTVCALARALDKDIDTAGEALRDAVSGRIHTFIATSPIHMERKLRMTPDQVVDQAVSAVKRARSYTDNVEFSPEDAGRSELDFLCRILEAVIDAGAGTVNIPDTVGYNIPEQFGSLIRQLIERVPNSDKAVFSVHCHNDLGLAVANSLAAVMNGARQVECTINGLGERAGNASLEEIVMAIKTRQDFFRLATKVNTNQIYKASRLVSELTGFVVQPNKAIIGANAFRHESGIHQDGVIKMPITYEIMDPKTVGIPSSSLVMGKLSGRHAFKEHLAELGYSLKEEDFNRTFTAFKELADKKKGVSDRDIESLIAEERRTVSEVYHLDRVQVSSGDRGIPNAAVSLIGPKGETLADAALGTGPVDAVYKAINRIVNVPNQLTEFTVKSVTEGIDAIGEVLIRIESEGITYTGRGADTDIIVASAKAYMNALNRLLASRKGS